MHDWCFCSDELEVTNLDTTIHDIDEPEDQEDSDVLYSLPEGVRRVQ